MILQVCKVFQDYTTLYNAFNDKMFNIKILNTNKMCLFISFWLNAFNVKKIYGQFLK